MNKIKIAISCFQISNSGGGLENALVRFLNQIDYTLYEITLFLCNPHIGNKFSLNNNVKVINIGVEHAFSDSNVISKPKWLWRGYIKLVGLLKLFLKINTYDIIIEYGPSILFNSIAKCKNRQSKFIYWHHTDFQGFIDKKNEFYKKYRKNLLNHLDAVVFVNQNDRNLLKEYDKDKLLKSNIFTIYNVLPIHQIIDKSNELINNKLINSDYIVMVARLDKQKDHATLFKAFVEVNKSHPNLNLVLLGDGGEKESLKILSAQLGLEDRIYFLGSVENPYAWIKNAKALILSTNYEGFGLVIIESICVNTVPIVSDIPQCLEAINHHKCGISFENHNAFDLVEKINLVLNNKYDKQTFLSERDKFLYRFISDTINVEFNTMVQVVLNNKREFN